MAGWLASLYIILCESQTLQVMLWLWVLFPVIPIGTYLVLQFYGIINYVSEFSFSDISGSDLIEC
jgi:hypothetical protein